MTLAVLDMTDLAAEADLARQFVPAAHRILAELVVGGAALGWVEPPTPDEVTELFDEVAAASEDGNGALRVVYLDRHLIGLGYWLRYSRPTHRHNADLQKIAITTAAQGRGIGRALTTTLIDDARRADIETLTLDIRGDNRNARHLYESLGFRECGRVPNFVAVHENRYDKVCYYLDLRAR